MAARVSRAEMGDIIARIERGGVKRTARSMRRSPTTVRTIAHGLHLLQREPPAAIPEAPVPETARCTSCGAVCTMPCETCRAQPHVILRRMAQRVREVLDEPISLDLTPAHRRRYERIRRRKAEALRLSPLAPRPSPLAACFQLRLFDLDPVPWNLDAQDEESPSSPLALHPSSPGAA